MKIHYNQNLKQLSRQLRTQGTLAEVLLWKEIRAKKIKGFQFMRQKPILSYIVDFYCEPLKLAIEVDGVSHDAKIVDDERRQQEIEKLGITFLRFTEKGIRENLESALREIEEFIQKRQPPSPLY